MSEEKGELNKTLVACSAIYAAAVLVGMGLLFHFIADADGQERAYEQGVAAGYDGRDLVRCPYEPGLSNRRDAWKRGWKQGNELNCRTQERITREKKTAWLEKLLLEDLPADPPE